MTPNTGLRPSEPEQPPVVMFAVPALLLGGLIHLIDTLAGPGDGSVGREPAPAPGATPTERTGDAGGDLTWLAFVLVPTALMLVWAGLSWLRRHRNTDELPDPYPDLPPGAHREETAWDEHPALRPVDLRARPPHRPAGPYRGRAGSDPDWQSRPIPRLAGMPAQRPQPGRPTPPLHSFPAPRAGNEDSLRNVPPYPATSSNSPQSWDEHAGADLVMRMGRLLSDVLANVVARPDRPARVNIFTPAGRWFVDAFIRATDELVGAGQSDDPVRLARTVAEAERRWQVVRLLGRGAGDQDAAAATRPQTWRCPDTAGWWRAPRDGRRG